MVKDALTWSSTLAGMFWLCLWKFAMSAALKRPESEERKEWLLSIIGQGEGHQRLTWKITRWQGWCWRGEGDVELARLCGALVHLVEGVLQHAHLPHIPGHSGVSLDMTQCQDEGRSQSQSFKWPNGVERKWNEHILLPNNVKSYMWCGNRMGNTLQPLARQRQTGRCTQSPGTRSQSISCGSPKWKSHVFWIFVEILILPDFHQISPNFYQDFTRLVMLLHLNWGDWPLLFLTHIPIRLQGRKCEFDSGWTKAGQDGQKSGMLEEYAPGTEKNLIAGIIFCEKALLQKIVRIQTSGPFVLLLWAKKEEQIIFQNPHWNTKTECVQLLQGRVKIWSGKHQNLSITLELLGSHDVVDFCKLLGNSCNRSRFNTDVKKVVIGVWRWDQQVAVLYFIWIVKYDFKTNR